MPTSERGVAENPWPVGDGKLAALVRNFDWTKTALGPTAGWPQSLRTIVEVVLSSHFPMVALWGPRLLQIYNDGYRVIMGPKHPGGLGQPTQECWPEVWSINEPIYARVRAGETVSFEDALYPIDRGAGIEDAWFTLTYSPLRDDLSTVAGVLVTVVETTAKLEAARANQASEERQAFLLKLTDVLRPLTDSSEIVAQATRLLGEYLQADRTFIAEIEPDGVNLEVHEEHLRSGATSVIGRHNFDQFGKFVSRELLQEKILAVGDITDISLTAAERAHYAFVGIAAYLLVPLVRNGRLAACLAINHRTAHPWSEADKNIARQTADRTWAAVERARAEAVARESDERIARIFDALPLAIGMINLEGKFIRLNPQMKRFLPSEIIPSHVSERGARWQAWKPGGEPIPPHDFPGARSLRGDDVLGMEMLYRGDDGREIWTQVTSVGLRGSDGKIQGAATIIADIDVAKRVSVALRDSEQRARTFLAELQHRVRNTLAVVRSIARRTVETADTVEDYQLQLDGRLDAFSRVQALVTRDPLGGVDLEYLVAEELRPYEPSRSSRLKISGPKLRLKAKAAETMALAVHELATNAAKYGALSDNKGRLEVAWTFNSSNSTVLFEWIEHDGPPPEDVRRQGLGSELIERTLVYELDAKTSLDFPQSGVRCRIELPFNDLVFKRD